MESENKLIIRPKGDDGYKTFQNVDGKDKNAFQNVDDNIIPDSPDQYSPRPLP